MKIEETGIEGLVVLTPNVYGDERGYFLESYNQSVLAASGIQLEFIQDNEAKSAVHTFRGFHYQIPPFGQSKLVRVIIGKVLDVVIDIRMESKTYGKTFSVELSGDNKKQLLVPQGFAHGYLCLEEGSVFAYKVDQFYSKEHEYGISYLDSSLGIDWPISTENFIVSDKDKIQPIFGEHKSYE